MYNVGGKLLFTGFDTTHGAELWRSDGTAAGTEIVKDIMPGSGDSNPSLWLAETGINGFLYFPATDGIHGMTLWKK